ncbi:MAG TPA: hypothetical protein DCS55_00740, partial [Acidimicrobiaceae bacterium]|nr:hypothetical protein [Acidimicrobiaceae bacterium]
MSEEDERGVVVDHDEDHHDDSEGSERFWESREVRWSAISGVLLLAGFAISLADGPDAASVALYVAATVAGARFFAVEAFEELIREREVGIELLMT